MVAMVWGWGRYLIYAYLTPRRVQRALLTFGLLVQKWVRPTGLLSMRVASKLPFVRSII